MNKSNRSLILLGLATAIAPFSFAQATGAVNAATNTAASVAAQTQAANAANAAAANSAAAAQTQAANAANASSAAANASINASTAASNAANTTANTASGVSGSVGASNSATGSTTVRPGMNPGATVDAAAASTVGGNAQAGSLNVSSLASQGASASLNSDAVVGQIRSTESSTRDRVSGEVQTRLEASAQAVRSTQERAREFKGEAQSRFQSAVSEVRARERQVRSNLQAFRNATGNKINDARSDLADSYEAYASAVVQLEAAGRVSSN